LSGWFRRCWGWRGCRTKLTKRLESVQHKQLLSVDFANTGAIGLLALPGLIPRLSWQPGKKAAAAAGRTPHVERPAIATAQLRDPSRYVGNSGRQPSTASARLEASPVA